MTPRLRLLAAVGVVAGIAGANPALARKCGGILRVYRTLMVNGIYNGSRFEDVRLDR